MPFRYSLPRVVVELVKAGGRFDRMADRRARIDAQQLSTAQLLASLRDNIEHPWSPPGGGPLGALSHDVIHGLDVSTPLGLDSHASPQRVGLVLAGLRPKNIAFFGVDLDGIALQATDIDWSCGSGQPVRGRAQDLFAAPVRTAAHGGAARGGGGSALHDRGVAVGGTVRQRTREAVLSRYA